MSSRVTIADATMDDLTYVASWLSDIDRTELSITRDPNDYDKLAEDAYCNSQYCKVALLDGMLPVFAFGARRIKRRTVGVWGFKTKDGSRAIRTVTKYLLQHVIPDLRNTGITRAICYVHPDNRDSQRWLAHLGFRPLATPGELGTPLIRYQRDEPVEPPA
jgi:hypothetical protein